MSQLLPNGKQQYFDNNGIPLVGGQLFTYAAGTTTPLQTTSDEAGLAPNTNPVILDARGEAVIFWLGNYSATLEDAAGNLIWAVNDLDASADATLAAVQASNSTLAAEITALQASLSATATTVQLNSAVATIDTALALLAPLASPVLTGAPEAPTAVNTSNDTTIATTAFVTAAVAAVTTAVAATNQTVRCGLTQTLNQGPNTVIFATPFVTACTSVVVSPYTGTATFAVTGWTKTSFTMNSGAGEHFSYVAVGT